jgi:hypothetical protein
LGRLTYEQTLVEVEQALLVVQVKVLFLTLGAFPIGCRFCGLLATDQQRHLYLSRLEGLVELTLHFLHECLGLIKV